MLVGVNVAQVAGSFGFYNESNPNEETLVKAAEESAKLNVDVLEINAGLALTHPEWITAKTLQGLLRVKETYGLEYTIHLPFHYLDLSSLVEPIRRASTSCIKQLFDQLEAISPYHYIVHVTKGDAHSLANNPRYPKSLIESGISGVREQSEKSVQEMITWIDPKRICIENLEGTLPYIGNV